MPSIPQLNPLSFREENILNLVYNSLNNKLWWYGTIQNIGSGQSSQEVEFHPRNGRWPEVHNYSNSCDWWLGYSFRDSEGKKLEIDGMKNWEWVTWIKLSELALTGSHVNVQWKALLCWLLSLIRWVKSLSWVCSKPLCPVPSELVQCTQ